MPGTIKQISLAIVAVVAPLIAAIQASSTAQHAVGSMSTIGTCVLTQPQRELLKAVVVQFNASGCPSAAWEGSNETIGSFFG